MPDNVVLFSGNSNIPLAQKICDHLDRDLGKALVSVFSNGETRVALQKNARGNKAFVIQPICEPVNDSLMELLVIIDALKRASVQEITAVIPHFGYARQDRKAAPREPITARLVADLITIAGAQKVITMDLHAPQIQGFFNIPVDNLYASTELLECLKKKFKGKKITVVSPDAGGVERARGFAKRLGAELAIIDKRRQEAGKSEVMHVIGNVKNRYCILIDDMIDTCGTIDNAANALLAKGAKKVYAVATHPVLSGPALEIVKKSKIEKFFVTDTIPLSKKAKRTKKFKVVSVGKLIGKAINRELRNDSVSGLFVE